MISFRQHVVSIVAVFLALAVGIVLGGGPLSGGDTDRSEQSGSSTTADGGTDTGSGSDAEDGDDGDDGDDEGDEAQGATSQTDTSYAEQFAAAAGARLYGGALAASPVALLAAPGADRELVRSVSDQVKAAGGRVTGRYVVQDELLDPDQENAVDTLGTDLVTQLAPAGVDPAATTYQRLGQLLGVAMATTGTAATPPDTASTGVRTALSSADLVTSPSVPVADAPLVVVVLGPGADTSEEAAAIEAELVRGIATAAVGTVAVGDAASAEEGGSLALLRAEPATGVVATVDGADTALGPVSTTLALIGTLAGRSGAFGAASADGALPLG